MREDSCLVVQRSSVVVEAVAFDRQDRSYAAQVRIQEAEGDKKADHRDCVEARTLVAAGDGKVEGADDHRRYAVAEAEVELVRGSIAALDDSRGRDWGWLESSRSRVEAASEEILLGCETSVPGPAEAAVGIRREVAIRREFAMRDQHPASPLRLRFDRPEGEEIGRAES
jgi:hypothetical protein